MMPGLASVPASLTIRSVTVEGNSRVPAETILRRLSAAPNSPFNPVRSQEDLRTLFNLGIFEDLQVQSKKAGSGRVDVIYHGSVLRLAEPKTALRFALGSMF